MKTRRMVAMSMLAACVLLLVSGIALAQEPLFNGFEALFDEETQKVQLFNATGRTTDASILIVPAKIEYNGQLYQTVLISRTDEGGLYDVLKGTSVHTLVIADGVEVWWLFGYDNSELRAVCLPDDVRGRPVCTVENSGLEMLVEIYPDVMYYVVNGSSAHLCCEKQGLSYAFRPSYASAGLEITQALREDDPRLLAYLDSLE